LKWADKATVFRSDAQGDLSSLPAPFDIVFMGPPYVDVEKKPLALVRPTLINLQHFHLVAKNGAVIAQHHKKENLELPIPSWTLFRQERYGDSMLSFFRSEALEHARD
jgi:16S rRNA G966 N2-methylase RsmD